MIISPSKRINTQQTKKEETKAEPLNISLSEKPEEVKEKVIKAENDDKDKKDAKKSFMTAGSPAKHTVYSNNPRNMTLKKELLNEDSKSLSLLHSNTSQMYPLNPV